MYSPARFPASAVSGSVIPRVCAEIWVSCCTMSKKVDSFLPASCQQSETVQVRICSLVQLCVAVASAEGVIVAGDCWALAAVVAVGRVRQRAMTRNLLAEGMGTFLVLIFK